MPVIKSAKKKLRKDKKREIANRNVRIRVKDLIKKARAQKSEKSVVHAVSALDKAVKKNIFHKNKAARVKSSLAKLLPKQVAKSRPTKTTRPAKK